MARVLIVFKDRELSNQIALTARSRGHDVEQAFLGFQAVHLFEKSNFDLILVDFKLADMYGNEILSLYQSWPTSPQQTILVITGRSKQLADINDQLSQFNWVGLQKPYSNIECINFIQEKIQKNNQAAQVETKVA